MPGCCPVAGTYPPSKPSPAWLASRYSLLRPLKGGEEQEEPGALRRERRHPPVLSVAGIQSSWAVRGEAPLLAGRLTPGKRPTRPQAFSC